MTRPELAQPNDSMHKIIDFHLQLMSNLTDPKVAAIIRAKIEDNRTYNNYSHYGAQFDLTEDHGTANIVVIAPNGDALVATSTVNTV